MNDDNEATEGVFIQQAYIIKMIRTKPRDYGNAAAKKNQMKVLHNNESDLWDSLAGHPEVDITEGIKALSTELRAANPFTTNGMNARTVAKFYFRFLEMFAPLEHMDSVVANLSTPIQEAITTLASQRRSDLCCTCCVGCDAMNHGSFSLCCWLLVDQNVVLLCFVGESKTAPDTVVFCVTLGVTGVDMNSVVC